MERLVQLARQEFLEQMEQLVRQEQLESKVMLEPQELLAISEPRARLVLRALMVLQELLA
jgi:hypothetical protein